MNKRAFQSLTAKTVEKALRGTLPDGRHIDGQGLSLLVRNNGGAASWVFVHNPARPAKQRQFTVGSLRGLAKDSGADDAYGQAAHSLKQARLLAAQLRDGIAKGLAPASVKSIVQPAKIEAKAKGPTWDVIKTYYIKQKSIDEKTITKFVKPWEALIERRKVGAGDYTRDLALAYRDSLASKLAPVTLRSYVNMLGAMFQFYIDDKQPEGMTNPFRRLKVEIKEQDVDRRDPMPVEIIKAVRAKLTEPDDILLWDILTVTGCRIGEIAGMKSSDVLDGGFVQIEHNDKRSIKNASSKRVIPVPMVIQKRDTEYYFAGAVNNFTYRFAMVIRSVTSDPKITTHSLRHAVTDVLRTGGVETIFEDFYLGHAPSSVAAKTYGSYQSRAKILKDKVLPVLEAYAKSMNIR